MIEKPFTLSEEDFNRLQNKYPTVGKNSVIEKLSIEIVKLYFLSVNPLTTFKNGSKSVDLIVETMDIETPYEIKGTESVDIAYNKLKVSSQPSYDALSNGLTLLRVSNVRKRNVILYFMQYGVDFELVEEPRWRIQKAIQVKSELSD